MVSQPGPGVTIITTPSASSVKPKRIFRKRFACCRLLMTILFSRPNQSEVVLQLPAATKCKARGLPIMRSLADSVFAPDNELRLSYRHLAWPLDSNCGKFFPCEG